ncbi:MAG: SIR2 family protein [Candidatus Aminicenantales bacterium]
MTEDISSKTPLIGTSGEETEAPMEGTSGADPWSVLQMCTEAISRFPKVSQDAGRWQPCVLYRGGENWLARFGKGLEVTDQIKNIREEVRALSAKWLRMQNVCVLLGAGASKYATGFVGSGVFDRVRSLLEGRPSAKTLDALLQHSSKPGEVGRRFEQFLSQVSSLVSLSEVRRWPLDNLPIDVTLAGVRGAHRRREALKHLLLEMERAIVVCCNVLLPPSELMLADGAPTPHETFLAKLVARDPQQGRACIFTTNYDTLVEQAMDRLGILYSDGFTGTVHRRFNPACYDLDLHYPGEVTEGRVRRYDRVLHLYKLHGSINWRRSEYSIPNPYGVTFDVRPLPTEPQLKTKKEAGKKGRDYFAESIEERQSLVILPTAAKYGESLTMPFAHLFRAMGQALQKPQTVLFVIGYSGWDLHVNQIVEDALANPGFTCVISDPFPSQWAKRLCRADYCGRVYCLGGEWGNFEFFAQQVLPDIEVLKTELAVARTLRELRRVRSEDTESGETMDAGGINGGTVRTK